MAQIDQFLHQAQDAAASDLHLVSNEPPIARIDGKIRRLEGSPVTPEMISAMIAEILPKEAQEVFNESHDIDFSYHTERGRFRVNCLWERSRPGVVARIISPTIPSLQSLGMPKVVQDMCESKIGLLLFTGPTGSGKSTNLAAVIEHLNTTSSQHIITLEDPIEFVYDSKQCVIRQREVGGDVSSFQRALKYVVRQDPDVVMVGEMRDLETITSAVTIAETGHLVLATLHTSSATQTIDRIIDIFPPYQQEQIRLQLSMTLIGVVAQQLVPRVGGGRLATREILRVTPAISNLIREHKVHQVRMVMETSSQDGMYSMDQDLRRLLDQGVITQETLQAHQTYVPV